MLSKIPHQVSFKTYPSMRYPDIDPILEFASSLPNISVYTKLIDFRYLIEQTRILVTSRTSSTLGWCMTSGKPVILIDFPGCPIPNNLYDQFSDSMFVFDITNQIHNFANACFGSHLVYNSNFATKHVSKLTCSNNAACIWANKNKRSISLEETRKHRALQAMMELLRGNCLGRTRKRDAYVCIGFKTFHV